MKFNYKDYSKKFWKVEEAGGFWDAPVIFECETNLLSEADELYKQKFEQDVSKQKHIVVEIVKDKT